MTEMNGKEILNEKDLEKVTGGDFSGDFRNFLLNLSCSTGRCDEVGGFVLVEEKAGKNPLEIYDKLKCPRCGRLVYFRHTYYDEGHQNGYRDKIDENTYNTCTTGNNLLTI